MSLKIIAKQFALNTSTGNQSITDSGLGGLTPSAVIFIASKVTALNTLTDGACLSYGAATSSTARWAYSAFSPDGNSDCRSYVSSSKCIVVHSALTTVGIADFVSFDTNGFTINVTTAFASGWLCTAVLFAGTDITNTKAGSYSAPTSSLDVTTVGFQPDSVFTSYLDFNQPVDNTGNYWAFLSYGFSAGPGGSGYRGTGHFTQDAQWSTTSKTTSYISTDYDFIEESYNAGSLRTGVTLGTYDSSGFTVTTTNSSINGNLVQYLAIKGITVKILIGTTKTSTGTDAITGAGFKPGAIVGIFTDQTATGFSTTGQGFGLFTIDNAKTVYSHEFISEVGVSTGSSDTKSYVNNTLCCYNHAGDTKIYEASLSSYDSDGITLNYTTANATGRKFLMLLIKDTTVATDEQSTGRGIGRGTGRGIG